MLLGTESLQTFGGSGFLQEYPLEQYVRDAKIDTLYEGTTAIQGQDLFFRKIVKDQGRALGYLSEQIKSFIDNEAGNGRLKVERDLLAQGLEDATADHHGDVHRPHGLEPGRRERRRPQHLQGRRSTRPAWCTSSVTWSSRGCCCAAPRSR